MPGQLIDVGGHRLHLNCTGSGSPTVVLEPGGGEMSSNLGWIAPAVARDTRVCVYDRAGRGWSEPADTAQDGAQIATDLHTLLQRGHVPGPYVLAGHSFGGLYVLTFAARYPDEVAGMVLVDSTAPASAANPGTASPGDGGSYDVMSRVSALVSTAARLGLGRLYAQSDFGSLPPRSRDEVRASVATASTASQHDRRVRPGVGLDASKLPSLRDFADKPLIVLTAGSGHDAAWSAAQNHLATLSTNSVHRIIDGATHEDLIADEEDAAATTQAILDVVSSVRSQGAWSADPEPQQSAVGAPPRPVVGGLDDAGTVAPAMQREASPGTSAPPSRSRRGRRGLVAEGAASHGLIIRLIIQTIRRDPTGSDQIDDPSNVSRPDPSGADQIDAEHQATDLAVLPILRA